MEMYSNRAVDELGQYAPSLDIAREKFISADKKAIAESSGAVYLPDRGAVRSIFLGRPCLAAVSDGAVTYEETGSPLTGTEQIIVLQNLTHCTGRALSGELVTMRELPRGGMSIAQTFKRRALDHLEAAFGAHPEKLLTAPAKIPCEAAKHADAAVRMLVLPRLPVIYAVWGGDDEFPASSAILFDKTAPDCLPSVEDVAIAASFGVYELIRLCAD